MIAGPIAGSVDILSVLHTRSTPLYALSNFSAETYPLAIKRFDFLCLFQEVIISGEVGAVKPSRRIIEILVARCRIRPEQAVFIDDVLANVSAARKFGMRAIHFVATPTVCDCNYKSLDFCKRALPDFRLPPIDDGDRRAHGGRRQGEREEVGEGGAGGVHDRVRLDGDAAILGKGWRNRGYFFAD